MANMATLKKYGLNINSNILYDDSVSAFFNWFASNISEENILRDYDMREYAELEKNNQVLSKAELDSAIEQITLNYPKIFDLTDDDDTRQQTVLEQLSSVEHEYENLLEDFKKSIAIAKSESSDLQMKLIHMETLENRLFSDCASKIKNLKAIQTTNQQSINEIEKIFLKHQSSTVFIYQFPLNEFITKCNDFNKYFELVIQKNFRLETQTDSTTEDLEIENYNAKMEVVRRRYIQAQQKLMQLTCSYRSRKNAVKAIKSWNVNSLTCDHMQNQIVQLNRESVDLAQYRNVLMDDASKLSEQIVNQKFELIMFEINLTKINMAKTRESLIEGILESSSEILSTAELLWIIMQIDNENVENFKKHSKYETNISKENELCLKRVTNLKNIMKDSFGGDIFDYYLRAMSNIAQNVFRKDKSEINSIKDFLQMIGKIRKEIKTHQNGFLTKQNYTKLENKIEHVNKSITTLLSFIDDGPLNRPQAKDSKFQRELHEFSVVQEKFENSLSRLKLDYKTEVRDKMNNDKMWRNNQLLWVWFLTEPKKVMSAIKDIKAKSSIEGRSAFKASGLMCKRSENSD